MTSNRRIKKLLEKRKKRSQRVEPIAPISPVSRLHYPPPPVVRTPEQQPETTALAPRQPTEIILKKMGKNLLVGHQETGAFEFWLDLQEQFLGGLQIRLNFKGGKVSASFLVANAEIEEFVIARIHILKLKLQERGFRIGEIEVICSQ